MSIENIKFILDILSKNEKDINQINPNIIKYIERIQFFIESKNMPSKYANIFFPSRSIYKYQNTSTKGEITDEEFNSATHYVLLQNIITKKSDNKMINMEKWQKCLVQTLAQTNLSSYCNQVKNINYKGSKQCNVLKQLFMQMHNSPTRFLMDSSKKGVIKAMGYFLLESFAKIEEKKLIDGLKNLYDYFQNSNEEFKITGNQIEQALRFTINSLSNKINIIQEEIKRNNSNVFQCTLARRFLSQYLCKFEINKELIGMQKKTNKQRATIIKGNLGTFKIMLEMPIKLKGTQQISSLEPYKVIE